jgi:hypothetical protein
LSMLQWVLTGEVAPTETADAACLHPVSGESLVCVDCYQTLNQPGSQCPKLRVLCPVPMCATLPDEAVTVCGVWGGGG